MGWLKAEGLPVCASESALWQNRTGKGASPCDQPAKSLFIHQTLEANGRDRTITEQQLVYLNTL